MSTERYASGDDQLHWFKSSHSGSDGGDCVEVAIGVAGVRVRDSKDTRRPGLSVSRASWGAFAAHVRR